ncbi:MAG: type II toxin-antitoxin system HigB family toxin [Pyrinomonadaceae bacterium]
MHTISRRKLRQFWEKKENIGSAAVLDSWYKMMDKGEWRNISDLRETFPHADLVGNCTIFNVGAATNSESSLTLIFAPSGAIFCTF